MQLDFFPKPTERAVVQEFLAVGTHRVPMVLIRNQRARRYVLRLRADGIARVTIPRGGSALQARQFAERHRLWIEGQLRKLAAKPKAQRQWTIGTEILFRGELVKIIASENFVQFGTETFEAKNGTVDLRASVETHLWTLAAREFPVRVFELAGAHGFSVSRVTVRNQRSRWGSCSRRRTISLNWRLIQAPPEVRDYVILHELAHLREMNHSPRFWREVERLCPDYEIAERWLRKHSPLLHVS